MGNEREQILQKYLDNKSVSTDTRTIRKGDLFFALKGPNFDGNKFVRKALDNGASYCIIDNKDYYLNDESCILVQDTLLSLQELAVDYRRTLSASVIGLTGSNGKTTTKELIKLVLQSQFKTFATKGNFNNHIGVPLTILSCPDDAEFLIVEMGANAQGEISLLSSISEPDYGLITNIGKAHLEGFGGVEGVIKGKKELYQNIAKRKGKIFINQNDDKLLLSLPSDVESIPYLDYEINKLNPEIRLKINNNSISSQLFGAYNVINIVAAVSIGHYFNIPFDKISRAIANYTPSNNRSTIKQIRKAKVIFDAYNANPTSMEVSIKNFAALSEQRKIMIIGDMLELGKDSLPEHKYIVELVTQLDIEKTYYVGMEFQKTQAINAYRSYKEIKPLIREYLDQEVTILIKGSRGLTLERLFVEDNA